MLEAHLTNRPYLVGDSCSIADIANFAYAHVAEDAGFKLGEYPAVSAWLKRVTALSGFVDDLLRTRTTLDLARAARSTTDERKRDDPARRQALSRRRPRPGPRASVEAQ